ncbi:glycosyltransferase family 4 protein [Alteromonas sp. A081]|uniref:glycosyltransferase family 4 protein n=1 Tax=Alteromonas sp. A081 TaxID=3410269 RepID=UPI003B985048
MKILYLINQYPKVSHTFIRREIMSLEALGIDVERVAMRSDKPSDMSEVDREEHSKTHYVLKQPKLDLIKHVFDAVLDNPGRFFHALKVLLKMYSASKQSLLIHLIYLVESCNVAKVCKDNNVNHIHAHFGTNPAEVAMYTSLITGVPYSFTVHGPEEFDKPLTLNLNQKIKHASKVIAITSYCRSQLYRWADYEDWEKINIVHCGLEPEFFDASQLNSKKQDQGYRFLCIGRLCEQKGQLLLLEAFRRFCNLKHDAHLTLAGDGEMRSEIEAFVTKHKLKENVTITGWIDSNQIKALLNNSDAMLLPSFAEGLPVAIMEAMATGVPVISTAIAGIPELLKDKQTGILVCPGSSDSLESALLSFTQLSQSDLDSLRVNAFEAVSQEHNVATEAKKLAVVVGATSK